MNNALTLAAAATLALGLIGLTASPAAAITCKNGYQLVQGNFIATPYCQDDLVAKVAREYGVRTSASEIRNNPNHKRHVCHLIGRDIRVQITCIDAGSLSRRGF